MKIFLSLVIISLPFSVNAQNALDSEKSKMTIKGTSSLHDWESTCEKLTGKASFELDDDQIKGAKNVSISMKVEDIESGKSLMDSKTYDAFKADSYPMIKGSFLNVSSVTKSGTGYILKGKAYLEMAGKKKMVDFNTTCTVGTTTITCKGSQKIDMTEYDMKPPTAMMGTIKVGKEVEVEIELVFKK